MACHKLIHIPEEQHTRHEKSCQNQLTFTVSKGALQVSSGKLVLSKEELVRKAETLNALHFVEFNLSYSSSTQQSVLFKVMFPDSNIAQSFTSCATKMAYIVKYGLGDFFKNVVKEDLYMTPFTFKFDESTTSQVKKQYDAYVAYWSKKHDYVVNSYIGSLFVGHCTAEDLLDHYLTFKGNFL